MNDPLENELFSLRPRPVSDSLRRQIARRMDAEPTRRRSGALAAAACVALASGVAALVFWPRTERPTGSIDRFATSAPIEPDLSQPSIVAYQRAAADSVEAFDLLLERHAATFKNSHLFSAPAGDRTWYFSN
jgi:hypothetical protein